MIPMKGSNDICAPPAPPVHGAFVLSTASAFSKTRYTIADMLAALHRQRALAGDTTYDKTFATHIFHQCKFDFHSVCLPQEQLFAPMTREEYLLHRRREMKELAEDAARAALAHWGGDPTTITHLYWGTMTGAMDSPTMDIYLATELNLSLDVKRTSVEGMGCLTGYRLLNLARETALGNPEARILVVSADLRSMLGNLLPDKMSEPTSFPWPCSAMQHLQRLLGRVL